jgi:hypothetical protein
VPLFRRRSTRELRCVSGDQSDRLRHGTLAFRASQGWIAGRARTCIRESPVFGPSA